jgi:hypothetical protein
MPYMESLRALIRAVSVHEKDIMKMCDENLFSLEFLCSQIPVDTSGLSIGLEGNSTVVMEGVVAGEDDEVVDEEEEGEEGEEEHVMFPAEVVAKVVKGDKRLATKRKSSSGVRNNHVEAESEVKNEVERGSVDGQSDSEGTVLKAATNTTSLKVTSALKKKLRSENQEDGAAKKKGSAAKKLRI